MSTTYCEIGTLDGACWYAKTSGGTVMISNGNQPANILSGNDCDSIAEAVTLLHTDGRLHSVTAVGGLYTVKRRRSHDILHPRV